MSNVFFTADHHFGHFNVIAHCNRGITYGEEKQPFQTVEEMDEHMIAMWNSVVGPNDIVHHLGDFAYKQDPKQTAKIFRRLNGRKFLVWGNHDKKFVSEELPWAGPSVQIRHVAVNGQRIVLCHYGLRTWPGIWRGAIHDRRDSGALQHGPDQP